MVKVSILHMGVGKCTLSSYKGEGLTAAIDADQPIFLTWRSFKQLLSLRLAQTSKTPQAASTKLPAPLPVGDPK